MSESTASLSAKEINALVSKLSDSDGIVRHDARESLVAANSHDVTGALIVALDDLREHVRWEAAKALVAIGDPIAAPALTHHLHDENGDVRWLAAEGVAELGEAGLKATLNAAIRHSHDADFCKAAHHAFKEFRRHGTHANKLDEVMKACEKSEPGVHVPEAALKVLEEICN